MNTSILEVAAGTTFYCPSNIGMSQYDHNVLIEAKIETLNEDGEYDTISVKFTTPAGKVRTVFLKSAMVQVIKEASA